MAARGRGSRSSDALAAFARPWITLLLLLLGTGCTPARRALVLPALPAADAASLLALHPADPERNITPILLGRSDRSSRHLVYVRDREAPHLHAKHDLVVTILRGRGSLWITGVRHPMRPGDVAVIEAGTPHYFANEGEQPAAAFVVFTPASDGTDTVPLAP